MGCDRDTTLSTGCNSSGLKPGQLVLRTIEYVRNQLPSWRDDPKRPEDMSEDRLNASLCKFLDSRARNEFPMIRFNHEEYQVGRRSADLSASPATSAHLEARGYSIYEPILIIECKRLPAPSRDREREYVTGGEKQSGGIQRFKLCLYARDHGVAALVGYVQDESLQHWHKTINGWISDLADGTQTDTCDWSAGEMLRELSEDVHRGAANCVSSHSRNESAVESEIRLHHLWIRMAD